MEEQKPKLCLITLGCKANQYDSAAILGYLAGQYILVAPVPETPADIYLINTCTVTHKADFDARQWIHRARRWNPQARIIVTGCMAEVDRETLKKEKVDSIFGISERENLILELACTEPATENNIFFHPSAGKQFRARAMLKVQEGCNYRCSYCVVPFARGKSRSLGSEIILEQMRALSGQGFEEVVLCGINLGEWGKENGEELADLILRIVKANFPLRIRLSSLEPMAITGRLTDVISGSGIICPHLHIPLQSGDDEILKRMKRPYSAGQFLKLSDGLFSKIPGLCMGLDVITGFPGEGDQQFRNTVNLLEQIPFGYLHIFTFSARPNTPAKKLRPKVSESKSHERAKILALLNQKRKREFALKQIGKKMEMVIEGKIGEWSFGHSENYLYLKARSQKRIRERAKVRLVSAAEELIAEEI